MRHINPAEVNNTQQVTCMFKRTKVDVRMYKGIMGQEMMFGRFCKEKDRDGGSDQSDHRLFQEIPNGIIFSTACSIAHWASWIHPINLCQLTMFDYQGTKCHNKCHLNAHQALERREPSSLEARVVRKNPHKGQKPWADPSFMHRERRGNGQREEKSSCRGHEAPWSFSVTWWQLEPYTHVWLNRAGVNVDNLCMLTKLIFIRYICSRFTAREEKIRRCGTSSILIHLRQ